MWQRNRPTGRGLIAAATLLTLLTLVAGCSRGGQTGVSAPSDPLSAVLVSSVTQGSQGSAGFETLHLAALDPATGGARWTHQTSFSPLRAHRGPVVAGGTIFVSSDALPATANATLPVGSLSALSERDGHVLWTAHLGALGAEPVVSGGVVYLSGITAASAGQMTVSFYALRADTGQRIWRTDLHANTSAGAPPGQGFGVADTLVMADGVVYDASNPSCFDTCGSAWLLALRASDGKQLWKKMVSDAGIVRAPVVAGGALYTVITSGPGATGAGPTSQLVAYGASDGAPRWAVPAPVFGPMTDTNGLLYVNTITQDQPPASASPTFTLRVAALDPATGATRWSVTTSTGDTDSYLPLVAMTPDALYIQSIASGHGGYTLASLDPVSGAARWRAGLAQLVGPLQVDGATLYGVTSFIQGGGVTERTGSLVALSASDGHALWSIQLPAGGTYGAATLARAGGVVVTTYLNNTLSAYAVQGDHHRVWSAPVHGILLGLTAVG